MSYFFTSCSKNSEDVGYTYSSIHLEYSKINTTVKLNNQNLILSEKSTNSPGLLAAEISQSQLPSNNISEIEGTVYFPVDDAVEISSSIDLERTGISNIAGETVVLELISFEKGSREVFNDAIERIAYNFKLSVVNPQNIQIDNLSYPIIFIAFDNTYSENDTQQTSTVDYTIETN